MVKRPFQTGPAIEIANRIYCSYNYKMLGKKTSVILALFLALQIVVGCGSQTANNANVTAANQNTAQNSSEPEKDGVKDNWEELASLIKMPFEPEDLVWKEVSAGNQGRRLLAVFQLSPADSKKLVENASKIRPGIPVNLPTEKWFPPELVSESELNNDEGIAATSYGADEFLQPPFTEGKLARVGSSDFFVLELFAK